MALDPVNRAKGDQLVAAHAQELAPLGAGQGSASNAEAFAELFSVYVTNRAWAAQTFPNATAALEALLRADAPDQFKAIEDIRAALDAIHRAAPEEVVSLDTISVPPKGPITRGKEVVSSDRDPTGQTVFSLWDRVYTSFVARSHAVGKAVTALTRLRPAMAGRSTCFRSMIRTGSRARPRAPALRPTTCCSTASRRPARSTRGAPLWPTRLKPRSDGPGPRKAAGFLDLPCRAPHGLRV